MGTTRMTTIPASVVATIPWTMIVGPAVAVVALLIATILRDLAGSPVLWSRVVWSKQGVVGVHFCPDQIISVVVFKILA